jgi:hypothetical protein
MVTEEEELAVLEEHLLWCHACLDLAEEAQDYVDTIQVGLLEVNGPWRARQVARGRGPDSPY